ncbi:uncharacterized protein Tco025E_04667 [Trypanosoma conorhini]|uniref:Uncharacterized protein n=1 Tax=Trypanosoma conorhini TaxID=83891 RepID=A0A422PJX2_9TRYP|nr:uncharacterized protein Tco025E_04667 [Trypanosoma conorhini]RNF18009.1 hypothetical protein Tco025E_04667 [Trypanosoma conorhini]
MRGCGVLCARCTAPARVAPATCSMPPPTRNPPLPALLSAAHYGPRLPALSLLPLASAATPQVIPPPPPPPPMRGSFIDRKPAWSSFNEKHTAGSFRRRIVASADVSQRPPQFHLSNATKAAEEAAAGYGEQLEELSARWAAKFYGRVTFGPRNYPYPSSRWLARRFKMKKHRIIKRFRFRRYKLAAVANLPFAKMIRVGLLPELKSSKTKKGDAVEADLSGRLVSAVRGAGGKQKGHRGRPKSKYQV